MKAVGKTTGIILVCISFLFAGCKVEQSETEKPANTQVREFPENYPAANGNSKLSSERSQNKYATPPPSPGNNSANTNTMPDFGNSPLSGNPEVIAVSKLIIPVSGVKKQDLRDTFNDARSEGRVHNALDIMAAEGAPVVAATDGKIVKFHNSERGGITIYQLARDQRLVLYYAHLKSRAENIHEGDEVKKGTLLGYVGDTGNSGTGNYHLHFAMWVINDSKRFWEGVNLNPYQYLEQ